MEENIKIPKSFEPFKQNQFVVEMVTCAPKILGKESESKYNIENIYTPVGFDSFEFQRADIEFSNKKIEIDMYFSDHTKLDSLNVLPKNFETHIKALHPDGLIAKKLQFLGCKFISAKTCFDYSQGEFSTIKFVLSYDKLV